MGLKGCLSDDFLLHLQQEVAWSLPEHLQGWRIQVSQNNPFTVRQAKDFPYIDLRFILLKVPLFGSNLDVEEPSCNYVIKCLWQTNYILRSVGGSISQNSCLLK